jgi:predicted AAA+ superfamily ATPase
MERLLSIDISANNAFFLWGARKTGKTTYLKNTYKNAQYIDLLKTSVSQKYEIEVFPWQDFLQQLWENQLKIENER